MNLCFLFPKFFIRQWVAESTLRREAENFKHKNFISLRGATLTGEAVSKGSDEASPWRRGDTIPSSSRRLLLEDRNDILGIAV